jgi:PTH1 family peptidyl-tRNA hydrolase
MKIIMGLGNPGKEFEQTRHNAGFALVDFLAQKFELNLRFDKKFKAEYIKTEIIQHGVAEDLYLIKSTGFMNNSGVTLKAFLDYFFDNAFEEDEGDHLIVAHDDLDLALGQFRLQKGKGPKMHNGLNSIYQQLGHKNFWHLRLGVDSRNGSHSINPSDYVLMKMNEEETALLQRAITEVTNLLFD